MAISLDNGSHHWVRKQPSSQESTFPFHWFPWMTQHIRTYMFCPTAAALGTANVNSVYKPILEVASNLLTFSFKELGFLNWSLMRWHLWKQWCSVTTEQSTFHKVQVLSNQGQECRQSIKQYCTILFSSTRVSKHFIKGEIINILGLGGHEVSRVMTKVGHWVMKIGTDSNWMCMAIF